MPDLRTTRRRLRITLLALLGVDLVALALLFSPLVGSASSRRQQGTELDRELKQKTRQVAPLRGLDQKVAAASRQIRDFYRERLPGRDSAISTELGKIAAQSGVQIAQAKYETKDSESVGLRPVLIEASLSGDYLQLARFINALERDPMFFIVNSVSLGSEQSGGTVRLQMKLETYLRTGA